VKEPDYTKGVEKDRGTYPSRSDRKNIRLKAKPTKIEFSVGKEG